MSILMDALKQQQQSPPTVSDGSAFWRKLALLLALLLAASVGALAAYWLTPASNSAMPAGTAQANAPVTPAAPATIVSALTQADSVTGNDKNSTSPDSSAAASAAQPLQQQLANAIKPAVKPVTEPFISPPPVATMTAGSAEAEPQPLAEAQVSAELRDKFASALQATESSAAKAPQRSQSAPATDIRQLDRQLQQQIPALRFDAHVYATTVSQRWVKVNGKTLQEGQWVTADIRIKEIMPQFVLLQLGDQLFSMAALSEWPAG